MRTVLIALVALAAAGCATDPWAIQNYMVVVVQARQVGAAHVVGPANPAIEASSEQKPN